MRIDGDTTKLKYAIGLTDVERKILTNFDHISSSVPGTLEIRKQIGHVTLAGEVFYGSSIFGTISPSERQGNLRIRLSRYRSNDPAVRHMKEECQECIGSEWPPLAAVPENGVPDFVSRVLEKADTDLPNAGLYADKNATPAEPPDTAARAFQNLRPTA